MNPLVSVNVATYNRAHLLPRALDSILAQTYQNLEIIVVDDCSSDNTSEVIKRYQEQDKRIKYIRHNDNKKLSRSRNTALEASNGTYIAFMDDDDEWIDSEKLKKQVELFESSPNENIAIICSSVRLYQNEGFKDKIIPKPHNLSRAILSGNGIMYTPTVMMQSEVIDRVGKFDVSMFKGVDGDLYRTCILKYGYDVYFMPEITTAIYEYDNDRMTPVKDLRDIKIIVRNQFYLLWKYKKAFARHPTAAVHRLKKSSKVILRLLIKR